MSYPKRLIEVDLPIKRISAHARREKSIRHGHISTLHIWWARRPLAACRAVICASLWPDPADPLCPPGFRDAAARLIAEFARKVYGTAALHVTVSRESFGQWEGIVKAQEQGIGLDPHDPVHLNKLRFALLDFIADFANWDNSTVPAYLDTARSLTTAAHEALGGEPGTRPLVVDPFAGGGSIPLEALRVGADAFASDLNPVAVLLNKVVLEYVPRHGQRLADEVRKWGAWVKEQAEKELAKFYPSDPDGGTPIAYLWARTIRCEGPGCGAEVPLLRTLWLAKKGGRSVALKFAPTKRGERAGFVVLHGPKAGEVASGTVKKGSATCPSCGYTTAVSSVRQQLSEHGGGTRTAMMVCVVTSNPHKTGADYRLPVEADLSAATRAANALCEWEKSAAGPLSHIPDESLPPRGTLGFRVQPYGVSRWGDLYTSRQLFNLCRLADLVGRAGKVVATDSGDPQLGLAVAVMLSMALGKLADFSSSLCTWRTTRTCVRGTFSRQALPMTWDFGEMNPFAGSAGDWDEACRYLGLLVDHLTAAKLSPGNAARISAKEPYLPDGFADAMITDPPYYDAVPYADLSDYFYVWHKRSLNHSGIEFLTGDVTPKPDEIIVDPASKSRDGRPKDAQFYEQGMREAMRQGSQVLRPGGVGVVVFAHKSTAGWEALLQGIVDAGWVITASWPIDTERPGRLRARESAALASSVHLVCRPRQNVDGALGTTKIGEWRDVLAELPRRIHEWMPRLAEEGVVGADAIFACLGPALEIFSRYSRVEKANGDPVALREYLEHVWAAISREALSLVFRDADTAGLEPDARLTAMWLWTLSAGSSGNDGAVGSEESEDEEDEEATTGSPRGGGFSLEFDAARKIAQGLGAHLEDLRSVVEVKGKMARLLPVSERSRFLLGKDNGRASAAPGKSRKARTGFLPGMADEVAEAHRESGSMEDGGPLTLGVTALDRVHQAMLLFGSGRAEAMRRFLVEDGAGNEARFWKLAQSLSALYPTGTEEKRWVDGVLARKKGLGF